MKRYLALTLLFVAGCSGGISYDNSSLRNEGTEYSNGLWFDGDRFVPATYYAVDGRLTAYAPATVTEVIDVAGGYVLPPLAEAHIHNLNQIETLQDQINRFLEAGVFYVMNQDSLFVITEDIRATINRSDSVDVIYAQCPMTVPTYGTVRELFVPLMRDGAFGDVGDIQDLDGANLCFVDSPEDIDLKLDAIQSLGSNYVKLHLAFSDQYDARRDLSEEDATPTSALNPELLPLIVDKAHARGLKVSSHVETAADFRVAAGAGVDWIAHLPGWRIGSAAGYAEGEIEPWLLTAEDARLAAAKGVIVITTSLPKTFLANSEDSLPRLREIHSRNLRILAEQDVTIAIGSDSQALLTPSELWYIADLGVFDNLTILKMAVEVTPLAIFPERKIGRLSEGYEANFIVTAENPIEDLQNLSSIRLRVKAGERLIMD